MSGGHGEDDLAIPRPAGAAPARNEASRAPWPSGVGANPKARPGTWAGELVKRPEAGGVVAVAVLVALLVVVFYRQLFDGWTFPWDFQGAYSASPAFVGASIGQGHFLSWSPYVASGFPVAIDPQSGIYFPLWWVLGALRIPLTLRAVTGIQVIHVLLGAAGVLALARVRRLGWPWAGVAAVAYLFFGGFYGEAEHADIFRGFAYLPWLLWALTPPATDRRWGRLAAVPALTWLIVSGAYPGQVVAFGLIGIVYAAVALAVDAPGQWRRFALPLGLAGAASGAVCAAVLLPYFDAQHANQLVRVLQPTAAVRAGESISIQDFLGLYLNSFAWTYDGTVTAWAVGVPILIGLACARLADFRRHAPLVACGLVALALAMTPKIGFIGKAMASLSTLFPSRFPASDYKAVVAVAVVIIAAQGWSGVVEHTGRPRWRAGLMAGLLIAGALLAPSTWAPPTRAVWLVIAVALAAFLLVLTRPRVWILVPALALLVAVDGAREIIDYRQLGHTSSWAASPADSSPARARDVYVRGLPVRLAHPPPTRPARVAPVAPLARFPTGTNADANGWTGDGYHLNDYGGTIERALWAAEHNPAWLALLLAPWHAYTFPCTQLNCRGGQLRTPSPRGWRASADVRTTSYGPQSIVYQVNLKRPELMIENELAIPGWQTASKRARLLHTDLPLRVWRLAPGRYRFTASYQQPGGQSQLIAAIVAVLAWLGCLVALARSRRRGAANAV